MAQGGVTKMEEELTEEEVRKQVVKDSTERLKEELAATFHKTFNPIQISAMTREDLVWYVTQCRMFLGAKTKCQESLEGRLKLRKRDEAPPLRRRGRGGVDSGGNTRTLRGATGGVSDNDTSRCHHHNSSHSGTNHSYCHGHPNNYNSNSSNSASTSTSSSTDRFAGNDG